MDAPRGRSTSSWVRSVDMYRKIPADLMEQSPAGPCASISILLLLLTLVCCEFYGYMSSTVVSNVVLSPSLGSKSGLVPHGSSATDKGSWRYGQMMLNYNITFMDMPCQYLSVDVYDVLGTNKVDIKSNVEKWTLSADQKKQNYRGKNVQADVLHDHDSEGNNIHGTLEELHVDGKDAVDIIDMEHLETLFKGKDFVFVDFYAPWCSWCQKLAPTWEKLAEDVAQMKESAGHEMMDTSIAKVDCAAHAEFCRKQQIGAYPTLRLFYKGEKYKGDYKSDRTVQAFKTYLYNAYESNGMKLTAPAAVNQFADLKKSLGVQKKRGWDLDDHPGCLVVGYVWVNKVPGRLQVEAKSGYQDIIPAMTNMSHVVNSIQFGTQVARRHKRKMDKVPSGFKKIDSMDGNLYSHDTLHKAWHHYLQVVPTRHLAEESAGYLMGTTMKLFSSIGSVFRKFMWKESHFDYNQMLSQSQMIEFEEEEVPTVTFAYDISPVIVTVETKSMKFSELVVKLMALVGGTYTVFSLMERTFSAAVGKKRN
ncbi:hypothetical protein TrST_g12599 [Triparma strigata]|uniref:Thioredoxin domain-containing protein n=1 Tax=Triparma strigata TaxID=1606541 RepID=A0A9W7BTZ2_9STRA|nr:hypothetical protein TrST_g12599 [Triparma strigata]